MRIYMLGENEVDKVDKWVQSLAALGGKLSTYPVTQG